MLRKLFWLAVNICLIYPVLLIMWLVIVLPPAKVREGTDGTKAEDYMFDWNMFYRISVKVLTLSPLEMIRLLRKAVKDAYTEKKLGLTD